MGFTTQMFENNDELDNFINSPGYGEGDNTICYGVIMQKNNIENKYEYLLRYNVSLLNNTDDIPNTNAQIIEEIEE